MKGGERAAFFTGGNSSCRAHIRQHYKLYSQQCKVKNIPENHYAIPRPIWRKMEEERQNAKGQTKLDGAFENLGASKEFTREGALDAIARFVACDDQVWPDVSERDSKDVDA